MPKREKFTGRLTCECGAKGQALFEENDNPVYAGGLDTEVLSASPPFEIGAGGKITCGECDAVIRKGSLGT